MNEKFLMIVALSMVLTSTGTALKLRPVLITYDAKYDFSFSLTSANVPAIASKLNDMTNIAKVDNLTSRYTAIADEIISASTHIDPPYKFWQFAIIGGPLFFRIIRINANITKSAVHITGGIAKLSMHNPAPYETHVYCDNFEYIHECYKYRAKRPLTLPEIKQIQIALIEKIADAVQYLL